MKPGNLVDSVRRATRGLKCRVVVFSSCRVVRNLFKGASESNVQVSANAETPLTVAVGELKRLVVFSNSDFVHCVATIPLAGSAVQVIS